VDGIIASLSETTKEISHFNYAQEKGIPVIFFDRVPEYVNASKIIVDNENAARIAVEHLIDCGKRKIAYIAGPESLRISNIRYKGYKEALQRHNLPINDDLLIYCDFNEKMGYDSCKSMIIKDLDFDGIFAVNDRTAAGALTALREFNIKVPEAVAVIGFNDESYDIFLEPALSTIKQPAYEIGKEAAHIFLNERNADLENFDAQIRILNTELLIRGSTVNSKT
jgi:DNA-binding LacI/PurR family transcriptional regulator